MCFRVSPTGTVTWKGREDQAGVLRGSMLSSHADRSLTPMRTTLESLPRSFKPNTTKCSLAKLFPVSFLPSSALHYYSSPFCHLLQSWETLTDDEPTFNHSNNHSSHSAAAELHSVCDEMRNVQILGATAGELHASPTVSHLPERIMCELLDNEIHRNWRSRNLNKP